MQSRLRARSQNVVLKNHMKPISRSTALFTQFYKTIGVEGTFQMPKTKGLFIINLKYLIQSMKILQAVNPRKNFFISAHIQEICRHKAVQIFARF